MTDTTVVSGVPGVGASEVCRLARGRLGEEHTLLNFGDAMLEEAVSRGLVADRDDLAGLSRRQIEVLQRRAAEFVASTARDSSVIVDTHLAVPTAHGYLPGLPGAVLSDLAPARLVLVEADPETIAERRERVSHREYREQGVRAIGFHQDLNRAAAMHHSLAVGCPISLVENEGAPEEAAEELAWILADEGPSG